MKTKSNIIRILAGFSLLIFFCPFFKKCSFEMPHFGRQPTHEKSHKEKLAEEKANTYSGYRVAGALFSTSNNYGNGAVPNPSAYFLVVITLSCAVLYFALRKSYANVFWFSAINLVLLLPVMLVLLPLFPIITARYGFYLLMANNITLIVLSWKTYRQSEDENYTLKTPVL